jgi:hypothetical protein
VKKVQINREPTLEFWRYITRNTVDSIAQATTREEVDALISDYFGFIRTYTRFMDKLRFDTKSMHKEIAQFLRTVLKDYGHPESDMVGYATALKFAYEKLTYDEVKDIQWYP